MRISAPTTNTFFSRSSCFVGNSMIKNQTPFAYIFQLLFSQRWCNLQRRKVPMLLPNERRWLSSTSFSLQPGNAQMFPDKANSFFTVDILISFLCIDSILLLSIDNYNSKSILEFFYRAAHSRRRKNKKRESIIVPGKLLNDNPPF